MAAAREKPAQPRSADSEAVERFRRSLNAVAEADKPIGVAVSGGPDSLALLLLAVAARPGAVEAATVDHGLRAEGASEAAMVAELCAALGVPHRTLTVAWDRKPETGLQQRARTERYRVLGDWAEERGLGALVTAHHLDDQAETFLMRLIRGAGVGGLGAMRRYSRAPSGEVPLLRPLLKWRRWELEAVCLDCGVRPVEDPSNSDPQFERTRLRAALAKSPWLDPVAIAASAANVAQADEALAWATEQVWQRSVKRDRAGLVFQPSDIPAEICRRVVMRAVSRLASENAGAGFRGREIDQLLLTLVSGRQASLRGVLCGGGEQWRFRKAPPRAGAAANR